MGFEADTRKKWQQLRLLFNKFLTRSLSESCYRWKCCFHFSWVSASNPMQIWSVLMEISKKVVRESTGFWQVSAIWSRAFDLFSPSRLINLMKHEHSCRILYIFFSRIRNSITLGLGMLIKLIQMMTLINFTSVHLNGKQLKMYFW